MSKFRIQYKDKPVILGGRTIPPYTFFINEQNTMTAFCHSRNIQTDKRGMGYIKIELLLSNDGKGYWYRGFLYSNGRVAYLDGSNFIRLRGLYPKVFDAFLSKFTTTEIKTAEVRHDVDDDARIFGDLPTMRQPQRCTDFVRYKDTRYQIHKLSSDSDSSKDFNENRSTNSCLWWYGINEENGHGRVTRSVGKTKTKDYTEEKPIYAGKTSHDDEKKKTYFAPDLEKYLSQFNEDEYAEVIFREAMVCLHDNFA